MLDTMHLECDERLGWGALALEDFWNAGASDTDTEGFVNELLAIKTVQIAALLREHKPLRIRVSLRSRGDYDVAAVAREFGGGGHHNAAGCSFECPLSEATDMVVERLKKCLASS
jgi:phosphoesterase RecJ-like protein